MIVFASCRFMRKEREVFGRRSLTIFASYPFCPKSSEFGQVGMSSYDSL
jgi:hypothetical protein